MNPADTNINTGGSGSPTYTPNSPSYPTYIVTDTGSSTTYSVIYQPEDRYGYINNVTARSDDTSVDGTAETTDGNFIKVVDVGTVLTNPYIKFYDASNAVIGGNGISLKNAKLNSTAISGNGTESTPYLIRLPKNAQSVQLFDGTTAVGSIVALDNDGGATLTVNGGSVTKTSTAKGNATIETPAYKTDFDYIYFTDTDNWKNTSDTNRIYAYYYGGVDGEYTAWPGVPAEGSYVDNNGETVYRFQPPSDNDSYPYPYVIFNNGSSATNPVRKITQKIEYQLGYNYSPTNAGVAYGTVTTDAKNTTGSDKAHAETNNATKLTYNKYSPDKYIYIVNNGTQDVNNLSNPNRFELDEMHVTFFDSNRNVIGTASPGYYADRIEYGDYQGKDVYKISVPQGAKSFRISNGQGKNGSAQEHLRQSVIEPLSINGLYQFVVDSDIAKIWNTGANTGGTGLNEQPYYLTLLNKREEAEEDDEPIITGNGDPVYMATVETGDNGLIKWITRLKEQTVDGKTYDKNDSDTYIAGTVDPDYLDHEASDIRNTGVTAVQVRKWGNYFWKEVTPPVGYEAKEEKLGTITVDANEADKTLSVYTATNIHKHGKVQLTKTAEQPLGDKDIGTPLANASFQLYDTNTHTQIPIYVLKHQTENRYYVADESLITTDSNQHKYLAVTDEALLAELADYETDSAVQGTGNFKLYDTVKTGSDGKLLIENLDWGEYFLEETVAPTNYSLTDTTTGLANKVQFSVGRNTCDNIQELICTDEIAPAKLKIQKEINEYVPAWGTPTFIFKIRKTDSPTYERYVSLQVTHTDTLTDATDWIDIEPGAYEVSELNVSRYALDKCEIGDNNTNENTYVTNENVSADKKAIFTVKANGEVTVAFKNVVEYYDKFSHNDLVINHFNGNKYLDIVYNKTVPVVDSNGKALEKAEILMSDANLIAYLIGADGKRSLEQLTEAQKKKLTFEAVSVKCIPDTLTAKLLDNTLTPLEDTLTTSDGIFTVAKNKAVTAEDKKYYYILLKDLPEDNSYVVENVTGAKNVTLTPTTPDDGKKDILIKAEQVGEDDDFTFCIKQEEYDERFANALTFGVNKLVITNPSLFADGVYRLKATYKDKETDRGVSGTVDLVFDGRNQKPKQYEKTLVFHADADNLSYFNDGGVRTAQYAFTFSMVLKDNPSEGYEIYSIRHNGLEVTENDVANIISNANGDLRIIEARKPTTGRDGYGFGGTWLRADNTTAYHNTLSVDDIKSLVIQQATANPLIYTAQLVTKPKITP